MGSHNGVAVLAATTAVAAVVVPIAVVVVVGAAAIVLARRARRCQGRQQWSGRRFVGVERRRSSSWTEGVQVDFLHHGIRLDVEVGDDGVDVRRRSGRGLRGRGRRGSEDQLLSGGLSFEIGGGGLLLIKLEIGGGGLLLIKELTGGQDATTRAAAFSSAASAATTRASSRYLRALASTTGRVMMSDDMTTGRGWVNSMGHCSTTVVL
jgi:hypothetical protein